MADKKMRYDCLTEEQQKYYDSLPIKKRKYIDARAQNYNKADSYRMAGFEGENASQSANNMERRDLAMAQIIEILQKNKIIADVDKPDSNFNASLNAIAKRNEAKNLQEKLDNMTPDEAERVVFFRDIATGKTKAKTTTLIYDKHERLISKKVVVKDDLAIQIQARKEYDRLLGINQVKEVGNISVGGNINITIVNASNEEELENKANNVNIEVPSDEVIIEHVDGEEQDNE